MDKVTLNVCSSCTLFIVLFAIAFVIVIGISSAFVYFHWYLKSSNTGVININPGINLKHINGKHKVNKH